MSGDSLRKRDRFPYPCSGSLQNDMLRVLRTGHVLRAVACSLKNKPPYEAGADPLASRRPQEPKILCDLPRRIRDEVRHALDRDVLVC